MLSISNTVNENENTVTFNASDGSSLVIEIKENRASIIRQNCDDDVYDALAKTAIAYARRRGIEFDTPDDLKETQCGSACT